VLAVFRHADGAVGLRTEFRDGDSPDGGADLEAREIAETAGCVCSTHPPASRTAAALLARNRTIVDVSAILVAAPESDVEELRSGTWMTVRYARSRAKPVLMLTRGTPRTPRPTRPLPPRRSAATGWEAIGEVASESEPHKRYTIKQNRTTGAYGCSCPSFRFAPGSAKTCKHITAFLCAKPAAHADEPFVGAPVAFGGERFIVRRAIAFGALPQPKESK
jgi:hypothetical protein